MMCLRHKLCPGVGCRIGLHYSQQHLLLIYMYSGSLYLSLRLKSEALR